MIQPDDDTEFGLQIAPILDLLFVLLLFFMVSVGSRTQETELGLSLSASRPSAQVPRTIPAITLRIDQLGQVYWNDVPMGGADGRSLQELRTRLKDKLRENGEQQPVIIVPDGATKQERLIDVLSAASAAHVRNLSLGAAAL